jgi:AcrR family transcriptional regulator
MPRRSPAPEEIDTSMQNTRRGTQRARLVKGLVSAANRGGYAGATVSAIIGEAGVSRPTFYEYFEDRDACFLAAILDVHERLLEQVRSAVKASPAKDALTAAASATVAFAGAEPADARFLMKETLAGGPRALDARDGGIAQTAAVIERAFKGAGAAEPIPDVPVGAVIGAIHRMLASRLRREDRRFGELARDLAAWLASYEKPSGENRWRKLKELAPAPASKRAPPMVLRAPPPLGPGRPRVSPEEVAENHRQRIMFATAQIVQEHGYTAATVTEITRVAGIDGRSFYRLFADKQEAFGAIHELGFQYLMAATAGAFFAGEDWPSRIWEAFRAAAQSIEQVPAFAHVGFVEAYAVGPQAIQRVEDSRVAFTIFLQEGYQHQRPGERAPSPAALEAIVTTIFEIVYLRARARGNPRTAMLAHIVHLCLAPFIGAEATEAYIDRRLDETREPNHARPGAARRGRARTLGGAGARAPAGDSAALTKKKPLPPQE